MLDGVGRRLAEHQLQVRGGVVGQRRLGAPRAEPAAHRGQPPRVGGQALRERGGDEAGEEQDGSGPGSRLGEQRGRQVVGGEGVVPGRAGGEILACAGEPEHHRGARLDGLLGLPEPPVRPAQRRAVTAGQEAPAVRADDQGRARTGPGPEQRAGGTVEHGALRGTVHRRAGPPGDALVERLEGPGRRAFSTEGLGHQAPELRHRNSVVPGVGDDHADAVVAQRDHVGPDRGATSSASGGVTVARATRPHRGSGNRPFALAGGTSLITPLPSLPPSSLDNGSRHRPPGGRRGADARALRAP